MQAEYTVELGPNDDVLEIPWASADRSLRYYDLRLQPELIERIPEAVANPPLREFLIAINRDSIFRSAKCDVWFSEELNPEEEVYGSCKFGSYVDLVVAAQVEARDDVRSSFEAHESLLKQLVRGLAKGPEIPASVEFILRRCFFPQGSSQHEGLYVTLYVFGYGEGERDSREHWAQATKAAQDALLRVAGWNALR